VTAPAFLAPGDPGHTLVKICGLVRPADVDAAVAAGADAIGFNFWPGSRRHLLPADAAPLVRRLPPGIAAVGVLVNPDREALLAAVEASGVAAVQLHGDEPPDLCEGLPVPVVKALRLSSAADLDRIPRYATAGVRLFLLDAPSSGFGGSGRTFDWELARSPALRGVRWVLAGGLDPRNVAAAVRAVRPFAVDVASGVEVSPREKDPVRMAAFVAAVRGAGPLEGNER